MTDQQTQQQGTEVPATTGTAPVVDERERIKRSEEMGMEHGAYNPAFMPGFRPDVYVPPAESDAQAVGSGTVEQRTTAVAEGTFRDAKEVDVVVSADQHMQPTAFQTGGTPAGVSDTGAAGTATGASGASGGTDTAGTGTTGAGTTGRTATGDAIETGQGSTSTSRKAGGTGGGAGTGAA